MTDEVGELVLADNYDQNLALVQRAGGGRVAHARARVLDPAGWSGAGSSTARSSSSRRRRSSRRAGSPAPALTTPELAVLLAYTKIVLAQELVESDLPDDPFLRGELFSYFPTQLRQDFREADGSRIRCAARSSSPRSSTTWSTSPASRSSTGSARRRRASAEEIARAHFVCREVYGANDLISQIDALDNIIDASVQTDMRLVGPDADRARVPVAGQQPPTTARLRGDRRALRHRHPEGHAGAARDPHRRPGGGVREPAHGAASARASPRTWRARSRCSRRRTPSSRSSRSPSGTAIDALEVARVHAVLAERLGLAELDGEDLRRCRATTGGRRWPGPRCATTSTPFTRC